MILVNKACVLINYQISLNIQIDELSFKYVVFGGLYYPEGQKRYEAEKDWDIRRQWI